MLKNYGILSIYCIICLILVFILFAIAFFLAPEKKNNEKNSAYECGFEPFDDAKGSFDVQFYTVGILFIIFDLELAYIYPWAKVLSSLGPLGYWTMIIFLTILTLGFIYEWKRGALNWTKK